MDIESQKKDADGKHLCGWILRDEFCQTLTKDVKIALHQTNQENILPRWMFNMVFRTRERKHDLSYTYHSQN